MGYAGDNMCVAWLKIFVQQTFFLTYQMQYINIHMKLYIHMCTHMHMHIHHILLNL